MNKPRIQDDLYMAINGEWLENAVIPDDKPTVGGFADLDTGVEALLMSDFEAFAKGEKETDIPEMKEAIKLYKKVLDVESRNKAGIAPVLPLLDKILAIKSIEDLNREALDLFFAGVDLPINFGVTEDMQDATRYSFIALGPSIILPDVTYYDESNPAGPALLGVYANMAKAALGFTSLSEEEKDEFLNDTLSFDKKISKHVKSQVEWADYVKNHNPFPLEEVQKMIAPFDLKRLLVAYYGKDAPETIIVYDPRALKEFNEYFTEENLKEYVHWAYVKCLLASAPYLCDDIYHISTTFRRTLTGIASDPVNEKRAYRFASNYFSEPIGVYYGRTYFGEEAKKDVVDMVKKIIETYKHRVEKNTFLLPATKETAIKKLSAIEIKMGYPDEIHDYYAERKVDENESLFDSVCRLNRQVLDFMAKRLTKKVDRTEWAMPGHMVNACYNPSANDITFPAAILQKPFYSLSQSQSENLGGIGAVIGHEISHAFDNNGSHFDENGNLANWWSESDFAAFDALTKDMIEQFDGIEIHGGKVNGTLVVSENIADNGGMGVTLEIMSTLKDADYQAYFINWAKVWCRKAKPEYMSVLLRVDVHSPAELRANMTPRNFPEWYKAFDVKETDQMYIAPEKRISIW